MMITAPCSKQELFEMMMMYGTEEVYYWDLGENVSVVQPGDGRVFFVDLRDHKGRPIVCLEGPTQLDPQPHPLLDPDPNRFDSLHLEQGLLEII